MKLFSKLVFPFFIFLFGYSSSNYIYPKETIFSTLNSQNENPENMKSIIEQISSTFNEVYTFNEISKNPPQPKYDKNYYKKINLQEQLKNINTNNITKYQFYQEIRKIIDSLGDYHVSMKLSNSYPFELLYFSDPFIFKIRHYENKARIFGEFRFSQEVYEYFPNYDDNNDTIYDIIKRNLNVPIKSINGVDPFEFITNFGGDFKRLKNEQATFRAKFKEHNDLTKLNFLNYPLSLDYFNNYTVVYDNEQNFTTEYIFISLIPLDDYVDDEDNYTKLNFSTNNINSINNLTSMISKKANIINNINEIEWNYNYRDQLSCFVDEDNKVNLYNISSFANGLDQYFIETIENCTLLFDKNTYPIILLNYFNTGGVINSSQYLLELLSPYTTINIYSAIRKTDIIQNTSEVNEILSIYSDAETCDSLNYSSLAKNIKKVNYGNNISDSLFGPFIFNGKEFRNKVSSFKRQLKNKRKPTDILIYSDGFTYSAAAIFIKYLQYYGGAITAGYFQNQNLKLNETLFNNGLSPSVLFIHDILKYLEPKGYEELYNTNGITLQMPGIQAFYNMKDLEHPLEYDISPVDEIVDIYEPLIDYDLFINESLQIFEKYQTKCNPNNKKLIFITNACDGKFGNSYTHGGYECGNDGVWTKTCVASYCDDGYIFDHINKKCIIDICSELEMKPEKEDRDENISNNYMVIIIFAIIVGIIIIIVLIIYAIIKRRKNNIEINSTEKLSFID